MAITPLLGEVAEIASAPFVHPERGDAESVVGDVTDIAKDAVVVCGYGPIGQSVLKMLGEEYNTLKSALLPMIEEKRSASPRLVAFDTDPSLIDNVLAPTEDSLALFGNGMNPSVLTGYGITEPAAIFVSYEDDSSVLSAAARLRASFPDSPIYARAPNRLQAQEVQAAGATEVVIESDELPRSAAALAWGRKLWSASGPLSSLMDNDEIRRAAVVATGLSVELVDILLEKYSSIDDNASGTVDKEELVLMLRTSNSCIASDDEFSEMEQWIRNTVSSPLDPIGFCRMYDRAPASIKRALDNAQLFEA